MIFVWIVCIFHTVIASLRWWEPASAPVTANWTLRQLGHFIGDPALIALLFGSTLCALAALRWRQPLGFIPQYFLFGCSFTDALRAIWRGQYPDGYTPVVGNPHLFIFRDQLLLLLLVFGYIITMGPLLRAAMRSPRLPQR